MSNKEDTFIVGALLTITLALIGSGVLLGYLMWG